MHLKYQYEFSVKVDFIIRTQDKGKKVDCCKTTLSNLLPFNINQANICFLYIFYRLFSSKSNRFQSYMNQDIISL